ncbi:MAG: hypothetical protein CVV44_01500 [Spirochaetae bacterium HGW-Spirochaetae-1]|jgi:hypothetical protein|nr:MAG: hypothetical protein CVV44_01500 [Spirochaetae bacterium HGW-Spirochaetae-1]
MEYINIDRTRRNNGKVHSFSSVCEGHGSAGDLVKDTGYWSSERRNAAITEYVIIEHEETVTADYIEMIPSPGGPAAFPRGFRFEGSLDNIVWKVIHTEKEYELETACCRIDVPLMRFKYLKVVITEPAFCNEKHYSEIGSIVTGISGLHEIIVSSSRSSQHDGARLIDGDTRSSWQSAVNSSSTAEYVMADLGSIYSVSRIILLSSSNGFPEDFNLAVSIDNSLWTTVFEEKNFKAELNRKYFWETGVIPARYVRLEAKGVRLFSGEYGVQLGGLEIMAVMTDSDHTHNIGDITPHASIFQAGVVKFAKDGEDISGAAVQGSDRRLRDATTLFKGIVQFAEDGDDSDTLAVQASDMRLKLATEYNPGIVRFAYDRENQPGTAVQGNDSRIQEATTDSFGIAKLCPDGLYTDHGVVLGSDSRLRKATTEKHGICRLSPDGESIAGSVVQSNDRRLRDATTLYKGIAELAEDGEDREGVVVQGNDRRLKDATTISRGIAELAEDGEDREGVVVQGNDRRLKDATTISRGIAELAEDGEDRGGVVVQGNDRRLKDATTESKGIVELADDGESLPGVVVQGNDKRLRDATETSRGIMQFAVDGSDLPLSAVQGSDRRLKDATTAAKGIMQFAVDGSDSPLMAVQGNDRRLKDASTTAKGIVELAEDGEDRPAVVVQGSDRRLKDASETSKGIMRFARNGEDKGNAAVQGDDRRLKDASTTSKGIVELAEDGEDKSGVAVQGDDRRLKDASTTSKGIVELAGDGENLPGVVVQGNDRRLKNATTEATGIVRLARNGVNKEGIAVQANDARLYDARESLPHSHDYARTKHEFNTHQGTISIKESKSQAFNDITPPSDHSTIIHGYNSSRENGSIGLAGVAGILSEKTIQSYGVVGHSNHVGVRGQAPGGAEVKGCGVLGVSRFGAGGVFASEHDYSLVADGYGSISRYDDSINLMGNGDALLVNGRSHFNGPMSVHNGGEENQFPGNIVEYFEVDEVEYVSPGDLLVVSEMGNAVLSRSRKEYNRSVIGVVAGNPLIAINNSGQEQKVYPVALVGKTLCKVDARISPVKPGDLIVASGTPGCGMVGKVDSFEKIGTVIGKAMDRLEEGIGIISVFITHL